MEWTDDLSVALAPEHTVRDLVEFVLEHQRRGGSFDALFATLTTRFGLLDEDVVLAIDRVGGGRARGRSNAPDPDKDPVAFVSHQLAHGLLPPSPPVAHGSSAWNELIGAIRASGPDGGIAITTTGRFQSIATSDERDAVLLWRRAREMAETSSDIASSRACRKVLELTVALPSEQSSPLLLFIGNAMYQAADALIRQIGGSEAVTPSTPAWFEAIALSEVARELVSRFRSMGDSDNIARAIGLRCYIITRLLGRWRHRVGEVMHESIGYAREIGDTAAALGHCEAIISDFAWLVDRHVDVSAEDCEEIPYGDLVGLRYLKSAIEIYRALGGRTNPRLHVLHDRCARWLLAHPWNEGTT